MKWYKMKSIQAAPLLRSCVFICWLCQQTLLVHFIQYKLQTMNLSSCFTVSISFVVFIIINMCVFSPFLEFHFFLSKFFWNYATFGKVFFACHKSVCFCLCCVMLYPEKYTKKNAKKWNYWMTFSECWWHGRNMEFTDRTRTRMLLY